jgi:hypothetical protein
LPRPTKLSCPMQAYFLFHRKNMFSEMPIFRNTSFMEATPRPAQGRR